MIIETIGYGYVEPLKTGETVMRSKFLLCQLHRVFNLLVLKGHAKPSPGNTCTTMLPKPINDQ